MSSRILTGGTGIGVSRIVWQLAHGHPESHGERTEEFQPEKSIASTEVAVLLSRVAELEHAGRAAIADAYRNGSTEGEARGRAAAQAALEPVLERMSQCIEEICALRPRLRHEAEGDVVQLALAIARRVVHRELSIDPAAMQALVQVALDRLDRQEVNRVWVHPSQAAAVKLRLAGDNPQVEVIADANREPGALLFETNRGKLDASVNAQFEEIERGLTDRVNQR